MPQGPMLSLEQYYADPWVRRRIREYCGDSGDGVPTCVYVARATAADGSPVAWDRATHYPPSALDTLITEGADVARSVWDEGNLLIHLDIDYQNTDFPGEAFHHPAEVFFKLEPVRHAAGHVLKRFDLPLLSLVTGQGYHFTGRVPLDSDVVDLLAGLVPDPPSWLDSVDARRPEWMTARMTKRHARAYVGAAMLVEFLAHQILRRAVRRSRLPIVFNGTVVGSGLVGRESVSIDLSYAGDPMDVRHIRVAFGAYQKHRLRPDIVGHRAASELPAFVAVPRKDERLAHLLGDWRDLRHAARLARSRPAALPIVTEGIRRLLAAYARSPLGAFHRSFYATPVRRGLARDEWFSSLPLAAWPPCVVRPLTAPNDLLLQPAFVQHVTRWLLAEGIPPRDISAAIHSRYAADYGWGARWSWLDAEARAEFDVRVFAGLAVTGLDRAVDFNCRSAQEKGVCPGGSCGRDLRVDRARLLDTVGP